MSQAFDRIKLLYGENSIEALSKMRVAVFGVGGVGGYVVEALARSGIGNFVLVDKDVVDITNLNRQIIALRSTIGRSKTAVMKERILDINPTANVEVRDCFFLPENSSEFDFSQYDYVVDAVDTVTAKVEIIMCAQKAKVPVISSMGAGNKKDPTKFQVADIYKTSVDPLARVMRREMKKRDVKKLKVVFSTEEPMKPESQEEKVVSGSFKKATPGSSAFVPSVCGLIIASEIVKDLTK